MGDADVRRHILEIRLAVFVVAEVNLVLEEFVEQGSHGKALLAEGFAADIGDFFHLVGWGGAEFYQFLFGLGDFPDRDGCFVF